MPELHTYISSFSQPNLWSDDIQEGHKVLDGVELFKVADVTQRLL